MSTSNTGLVLNGLYVGSSTPVANQKGLLIDNKYFIPLVESSGSGTDTSDATAVASDIITGKTAYTVDGKVTGTLPKLTVTYDDTMFTYTAAHDGYLNAGDQVLDFSAATSGTASGAGMLQGDIAWVNGQQIIGEIPIVSASISGNTVTVPYGYHESTGTFTIDSYTGSYTVQPGVSNQTLATSGKYMTSDVTISGDANLVADNIKKGVSIFGVAGTYQGSTQIINGGDYYKCTSVDTSSTVTDGKTIVVDDTSVWSMWSGTYTLVDESATGDDRVWRDTAGLRIKKESFDGKLRWGFYDVDDNYAWCLQEGVHENPWDEATYIQEESGEYNDIAMTPSTTSVPGNTWSGYKAVFDSTAGTWSFEETETSGLNYSAVTPVPGFIYNDDCTVLVKSLYVGVAEIPTDNLFYYLPLSENYNTSVGAETSIGTGTLSFTSEDSIRCAKFDGTQYLNTTSLVNQPNMTFSFWAKKTGTDVGVVIGQPYNSYIALSNTSLSLMANATDTSVNVSTTTWHHYAVKKVGVQWSVYVDGVLEHTWSGKDFDRSGNTMRIGVHGYDQSYLRFNGYLTSIRIYYKALTDAEIVALSKELSPTKQ